MKHKKYFSLLNEKNNYYYRIKYNIIQLLRFTNIISKL